MEAGAQAVEGPNGAAGAVESGQGGSEDREMTELDLWDARLEAEVDQLNKRRLRFTVKHYADFTKYLENNTQFDGIKAFLK